MQNDIKPINYVHSYVAFLDVLGFKELIYSKKDKEKLEKVLSSYKRIYYLFKNNSY